MHRIKDEPDAIHPADDVTQRHSAFVRRKRAPGDSGGLVGEGDTDDPHVGNAVLEANGHEGAHGQEDGDKLAARVPCGHGHLPHRGCRKRSCEMCPQVTYR